AEDEARAPNPHHVLHHGGVVLPGLLGGHGHLTEARGHVAVAVSDQLHQQHAVDAAVGFRHPHTGGGEPVEGRHLGVVPGVLLLLATEAGAFLHGPGAAAVAPLAALLVLHRLAEAALVRLLVDCGAAQLIAAANDVDVRLLAAQQGAHHLVHQAVVHQGLYAFGGFHSL